MSDDIPVFLCQYGSDRANRREETPEGIEQESIPSFDWSGCSPELASLQFECSALAYLVLARCTQVLRSGGRLQCLCASRD